MGAERLRARLREGLVVLAHAEDRLPPSHVHEKRATLVRAALMYAVEVAYRVVPPVDVPPPLDEPPPLVLLVLLPEVLLELVLVLELEAAPVLITRCTVLPGARLLPAVGVWLMTQPEVTVELDWYSVVTVKPSLVSTVSAVPSLWPTTLGT